MESIRAHQRIFILNRLPGSRKASLPNSGGVWLSNDASVHSGERSMYGSAQQQSRFGRISTGGSGSPRAPSPVPNRGRTPVQDTRAAAAADKKEKAGLMMKMKRLFAR